MLAVAALLFCQTNVAGGFIRMTYLHTGGLPFSRMAVLPELGDMTSVLCGYNTCSRSRTIELTM